MDEGNGNPDLPAWEANAEHWDDYMGDDSNEWHRGLVRPGVTALLDPHPGERILDIACGNGNYSAYLADMGVMVTAFDFSPRMVGFARRRRQHTMVPVDFCVADASDAEDIASLGEPGGFDKAVCNMGFMDISDIGTLLAGIHRLLAPGGTLVFATQHPCFVTLTDLYLTRTPIRGTPSRDSRSPTTTITATSRTSWGHASRQDSSSTA